MKTPIYPTPAVYKLGRKLLATPNRRYIHLNDTHSENFIEAVERFCIERQLPLSLTYGSVCDGHKLVSLKLTKSGESESYQITTSQAGYTLSAPDECGLFRGLATLAQLIDSQELRYVDIKDQPDFANRGVMLDISRCKVPSMATFKQLIDQFAALKYNQLQLYTEHTFAFTQHETVWADASPLTAAEILTLKHYASARYIDLVPNLNCFGHFERWLRHPEYHRFAECPEGFVHPLTHQKMPFGSTLSPTATSLKLVRELHDEYLPLFDSRYVNVGGDEPWELGLGVSKKRCDKTGTTNVYIDFLSQIQKLVEKRGSQMMFWSDIVLKQPESLKHLSKQLIAMNWGYEANHPFKRESEQVAKQKIPFYVCPGTSSWNSLIGRTQNMSRNIQSAAKQGVAHGADGLLVTDWGDHGHHQYLPISYPGFVVAACESWRQGSTKSIDLADAVNTCFLGTQDLPTATHIIELGKVLELTKSPIRNATIFNRLLFWGMQHEPRVTQSIPTGDLTSSKAMLSGLLEEISTNKSIVGRELTNAARMALHGLNRLLYHRKADDFSGTSALTELRQEIRIIIGQHESLWLSRNRVGGMRESVSHLEKSQSAYSEKPVF